MNLSTRTLGTFVLLLQTLHFIFMHAWEWARTRYILGAAPTEHTKPEALRNTRSSGVPPCCCHSVADRTRCTAVQNHNLKLQLLKSINPKLGGLDSRWVSCPVFRSGKLSFREQAPAQRVTTRSPHSDRDDAEVLPQGAPLSRPARAPSGSVGGTR